MTRYVILAAWIIVLAGGPALAAKKKAPETQPAEPGDGMIHAYLSRLAVQLDAGFLPTLPKADEWDRVRADLMATLSGTTVQHLLDGTTSLDFPDLQVGTRAAGERH